MLIKVTSRRPSFQLVSHDAMRLLSKRGAFAYLALLLRNSGNESRHALVVESTALRAVSQIVVAGRGNCGICAIVKLL